MDQAILTAAFEVIGTHGVRGATMDRIAHQAGVSRGSIYRRYRSIEEILVALNVHLATQVDLDDHGDVAADLTALAESFSNVYRDRQSYALETETMTISADHHPDLAEAIRGANDAQRQRTREIINRAIRRGQLRADTNPDVVIDALAGALLYHVGRRLAPPEPGYARQIVDHLLRGIRA